MTQLEVLSLVAITLNRLEIDYMVVGAHCVNFYGKPRITTGIDFEVEMDYYDKEKFCGAFETGFYVDKEVVGDTVLNRTTFSIIHRETQTNVYFWMVGDTEFDKERFARRTRASIHQVSVCMATAEDAIIARLDWFKESAAQIHYEEALGIFENQKDELDLVYLEKRCKELSIEDLLEKLISETA